MITMIMIKGNQYKTPKEDIKCSGGSKEGKVCSSNKASSASPPGFCIRCSLCPGNIFSPCHIFHSPLPSGLSLCFHLVQAFPDHLSQRRLPSIILCLSSLFVIVVYLHSILYSLWLFHSFVNLLHFFLSLHVAYKLHGLIWSLHISSRTRSACLQSVKFSRSVVSDSL